MMKKENTKQVTIRYTYTNKVHHSCELLDYLLQKLPESRNTVKSLLSRNKVLVNGSVVRQFNYPLAKDDEVKIAKNPVVVKQVSKKKKKDEPHPFNIKPYIIYEDDYYIAINKPNGMLSVQSDNQRESAYTFVEDYLKKKDPKLRPYVLHRIDKETSGVLVFAKDIKVHSMLKGHWNQDVSEREYIAVINGNLDNDSGTIKNYLKENKNNMMYVADSGKLAITHYKVLNKNKDYSLLQVNIDSGRKNQIRVAMASLDHPIIGDDKYGDGLSPINRLGLHASKLSFVDPISKELLTFKAPEPKEFKGLFNK